MNQHTVSIPFWGLTSKQAWTATLKAITKLTKDVEKLSQEIAELRAEIAAETDEDVRTGKQIELLQATITELESKLDEADAAVEAAKNGEAGAIATLEETLAAVREVTAELRADNPVVDNTLPGDQPHVDNTLPGDLPQ